MNDANELVQMRITYLNHRNKDLFIYVAKTKP